MTRKTATPNRTLPDHLPGCDAWHSDDMSCVEALEARNEQVLPARWDCRNSPSRTQPSHSFDFSQGLPDDELECIHGCGMTWDRLRGAE